MAITILPILLVAATLFWWEYEIERQGQYNSLILSASRQYQVPRELIKAVIWRESRFTEDAYGKAKERGLMQVTPAAGKDWAKAEKIPNFQPESLYIPNTNVRAGTWYLARALKRWNKADDPVVFALAEYNAGPVHARRWAAPLKQSLKSEAFMDNIDYPTTHKYILDIKERMAFYKASPSPSPWEFVQDRIKIYWNKWKSRSSNSNR
ncbi:MAG: transglycosylase SLT domain-containing protein [Verrucomicrobiota bacterium]